jgi:branched-subunit amino acid transport protein
MAGERQENSKLSGWWIAALWFAGVAMFVVEWNAGLEYVEARLSEIAPSFLGYLPAVAVAALKLEGSAFWNAGYLEATFRMMPLTTLPIILGGLGLALKDKIGFPRQRATK